MQSSGSNTEKIRDEIEKDFENAYIFDPFEEMSPDETAISTGLFGVDRILDIGGIPVNRITELFGMESTGKSTFALMTIAEANKAGGIGIYFDAESGLEGRYLRKLGVKRELFQAIRTDYGEETFEIILKKLISDSNIRVIVIDSLAALVPKKEFDRELIDSEYAAKASMMAKALRKLVKPLGNSDTALIIINQLIDNIGGYGRTTPGGRALKFYASLRLELTIDPKISLRSDKEVGITINVRKNKVGIPHQECTQLLKIGKGFDPIYDLYNEALYYDILERRGSWIAWGDEKYQGLTALLEFLESDEDGKEKLQQEVMLNWEMKRSRIL